MKNSKRKLILPALVVGMGIFGAFVSTAHTADTFAPEIGYVENDEPCDTPVNCDTTGGELCTVQINGQTVQAFGKLTPASDCNRTLYRRVQE